MRYMFYRYGFQDARLRPQTHLSISALYAVPEDKGQAVDLTMF